MRSGRSCAAVGRLTATTRSAAGHRPDRRLAGPGGGGRLADDVAPADGVGRGVHASEGSEQLAHGGRARPEVVYERLRGVTEAERAGRAVVGEADDDPSAD